MADTLGDIRSIDDGSGSGGKNRRRRSKHQYIHSQTILNNILFGKTMTEKTEAREKIDQSIIQLLIEEDLLETIVEIGMQFQVGTKGDRLSGGQRQKLAIARSFLKKPWAIPWRWSSAMSSMVYPIFSWMEGM